MSETTTCKFCKWEISIDAVKCKHCWEFLDDKYRMPNTVIYRSMFQPRPKIYCPNCKYEWRATYTTKWNWFITLILLCFFIIPGIIYHIRWNKMYFICPKCKNPYINKN